MGQGVSERFQIFIILLIFDVILKNVSRLLLQVPQIVAIQENSINKHCRGDQQFLSEFFPFLKIFEIVKIIANFDFKKSLLIYKV